MIPCMKFCGLSQMADVEAVNAVGPAYVGFVFWPKSPRAVTDEEALALRGALDERIVTVGVFVDEPIDHVAELFRAGTISIAQLHGAEDETYLDDLRGLAPDLEVWKAFQVSDEADIARANESGADLVLLDAGRGCGQRFDWNLLTGVNRSFALAGGLDAENVADAVTRVPATAPLVVVDVSSGIEADEAAPDGRRRKDLGKMQRFAAALR